ncbi:Plug domain-containing protein [Niabella defluvii]|nr:Plug domain-containing protein [Niabella sp. I65]
MGSPFGLTNDGLDPGVGYYVDGVYYARPAVATLDFVDIERIEVLRGPQGHYSVKTLHQVLSISQPASLVLYQAVILK